MHMWMYTFTYLHIHIHSSRWSKWCRKRFVDCSPELFSIQETANHHICAIDIHGDHGLVHEFVRFHVDELHPRNNARKAAVTSLHVVHTHTRKHTHTQTHVYIWTSNRKHVYTSNKKNMKTNERRKRLDVKRKQAQPECFWGVCELVCIYEFYVWVCVLHACVCACVCVCRRYVLVRIVCA